MIEEWLPAIDQALVDLCAELGIPARERIDPDLGTLQLVPSWARAIWRATGEKSRREALALARDSSEHRAALLAIASLRLPQDELRAALDAYLGSIRP